VHYAVDEGLVAVTEPITVVRMLNHNSHARIVAHVPVHRGLAAYEGEYRWTEYQGPEHHRSGVSQPGRERVRPSPADWASARPDRDHARRVRHLDCRCPLLSLLAEIRGGCAVLLKVAARADELRCAHRWCRGWRSCRHPRLDQTPSS
jgi:hypothetical protein